MHGQRALAGRLGISQQVLQRKLDRVCRDVAEICKASPMRGAELVRRLIEYAECAPAPSVPIGRLASVAAAELGDVHRVLATGEGDLRKEVREAHGAVDLLRRAAP